MKSAIRFLSAMMVILLPGAILTGCAAEVVSSEYVLMSGETSSPVEIFIENNDEYGEGAFDTEQPIPEPIETVPGSEPIDEVWYPTLLWEFTTLRFYYYDTYGWDGTTDYPPLSFIEVSVSGENWLEQAPYYMRLHTEIEVSEIWYDGRRIYADLLPEIENRLQGTLGASLTVRTLILSLANFPDVEEIVILIDGEHNVWGWHFSFDGVFVLDDLNAEQIWTNDSNIGRLKFIPNEA